MNKSDNFSSFKKAVSMVSIPRFNIVYADREDNIFYMVLQIPIRKEIISGINCCQEILQKPNTRLSTYRKSPQVLNPEHGYIFNTNNSPFNCAHPKDNLKENTYDSTLGYRKNNRSVRFMELIAQYEKLNYKDF